MKAIQNEASDEDATYKNDSPNNQPTHYFDKQEPSEYQPSDHAISDPSCNSQAYVISMVNIQIQDSEGINYQGNSQNQSSTNNMDVRTSKFNSNRHQSVLQYSTSDLTSSKRRPDIEFNSNQNDDFEGDYNGDQDQTQWKANRHINGFHQGSYFHPKESEFSYPKRNRMVHPSSKFQNPQYLTEGSQSPDSQPKAIVGQKNVSNIEFINSTNISYQDHQENVSHKQGRFSLQHKLIECKPHNASIVESQHSHDYMMGGHSCNNQNDQNKGGILSNMFTITSQIDIKHKLNIEENDSQSYDNNDHAHELQIHQMVQVENSIGSLHNGYYYSPIAYDKEEIMDRRSFCPLNVQKETSHEAAESATNCKYTDEHNTVVHNQSLLGGNSRRVTIIKQSSNDPTETYQHKYDHSGDIMGIDHYAQQTHRVGHQMSLEVNCEMAKEGASFNNAFKHIKFSKLCQQIQVRTLFKYWKHGLQMRRSKSNVKQQNNKQLIEMHSCSPNDESPMPHLHLLQCQEYNDDQDQEEQDEADDQQSMQNQSNEENDGSNTSRVSQRHYQQKARNEMKSVLLEEDKDNDADVSSSSSENEDKQIEENDDQAEDDDDDDDDDDDLKKSSCLNYKHDSMQVSHGIEAIIMNSSRTPQSHHQLQYSGRSIENEIESHKIESNFERQGGYLEENEGDQNDQEKEPKELRSDISQKDQEESGDQSSISIKGLQKQLSNYPTRNQQDGLCRLQGISQLTFHDETANHHNNKVGSCQNIKKQNTIGSNSICDPNNNELRFDMQLEKFQKEQQDKRNTARTLNGPSFKKSMSNVNQIDNVCFQSQSNFNQQKLLQQQQQHNDSIYKGSENRGAIKIYLMNEDASSKSLEGDNDQQQQQLVYPRHEQIITIIHQNDQISVKQEEQLIVTNDTTPIIKAQTSLITTSQPVSIHDIKGLSGVGINAHANLINIAVTTTASPNDMRKQQKGNNNKYYGRQDSKIRKQGGLQSTTINVQTTTSSKAADKKNELFVKNIKKCLQDLSPKDSKPNTEKASKKQTKRSSSPDDDEEDCYQEEYLNSKGKKDKRRRNKTKGKKNNKKRQNEDEQQVEEVVEEQKNEEPVILIKDKSGNQMTFKDSEVEIIKKSKKSAKVFIKLSIGKMIEAEQEEIDNQMQQYAKSMNIPSFTQVYSTHENMRQINNQALQEQSQVQSTDLNKIKQQKSYISKQIQEKGLKGNRRSFKKRNSIYQKQMSSKKCKDSDDCQQKGRFTVTNKHLDENGEPIEGDELTNGGGSTPNNYQQPVMKERKMSRRQTIIEDIMLQQQNQMNYMKAQEHMNAYYQFHQNQMNGQGMAPQSPHQLYLPFQNYRGVGVGGGVPQQNQLLSPRRNTKNEFQLNEGRPVKERLSSKQKRQLLNQKPLTASNLLAKGYDEEEEEDSGKDFKAAQAAKAENDLKSIKQTHKSKKQHNIVEAHANKSLMEEDDQVEDISWYHNNINDQQRRPSCQKEIQLPDKRRSQQNPNLNQQANETKTRKVQRQIMTDNLMMRDAQRRIKQQHPHPQINQVFNNHGMNYNILNHQPNKMKGSLYQGSQTQLPQYPQEMQQQQQLQQQYQDQYQQQQPKYYQNNYPTYPEPMYAQPNHNGSPYNQCQYNQQQLEPMYRYSPSPYEQQMQQMQYQHQYQPDYQQNTMMNSNNHNNTNSQQLQCFEVMSKSITQMFGSMIHSHGQIMGVLLDSQGHSHTDYRHHNNAHHNHRQQRSSSESSISQRSQSSESHITESLQHSDNASSQVELEEEIKEDHHNNNNNHNHNHNHGDNNNYGDDQLKISDYDDSDIDMSDEDDDNFFHMRQTNNKLRSKKDHLKMSQPKSQTSAKEIEKQMQQLQRQLEKLKGNKPQRR